jgi:hypothetical protein
MRKILISRTTLIIIITASSCVYMNIMFTHVIIAIVVLPPGTGLPCVPHCGGAIFIATIFSHYREKYLLICVGLPDELSIDESHPFEDTYE